MSGRKEKARPIMIAFTTGRPRRSVV